MSRRHKEQSWLHQVHAFTMPYDDTSLVLTRCGRTLLWSRITLRPCDCPQCKKKPRKP